MRKLILILPALLYANLSFLQVVFQVTEPEDLVGSYDFTYPEDGSGW